MKKRFFKFIQIDKEVIKNFCDAHVEINKFIDFSAPFYVRVGIKPFPTLVHTIITQQDDPVELINFRLDTLSKKLKFHITPKKIMKLSQEGLVQLLGEKCATTIRAISQDIVDKKLNLKKLSKGIEQNIHLALSVYPNMTISIIKLFALFGCFKKNVYCKEEKEFIEGLKIFLNKNEISKQDIDNIFKQYDGDLTLFSLCMFKIYNEKAGK